jgi:signal transduction histidine kinase/ligand-binding sensor domain-containing protein
VASLRFDRLTVADGLPTNWVMTVLKDSYGFVWLGTRQGLARYDGTNLSIYRSDPEDPRTLPAPFVGLLYEDREKRLWAGFAWANAGVALYNRECDCFQRFGTSTAVHDVRAMVEDRKGRFWIGTEDGISEFDPAKGYGRSYPLKKGTGRVMGEPVVNALLEDRAGRLWVGTDGGLFRFDPERGAYELWPGDPADPQSLSRAAIWNLLEDADGTLWAATIGAGLQHANPESGEVTRYLPDPKAANSISSARVRGLARSADGRIFAGTENGGLNVLDPQTGRFLLYGPKLDDLGSFGSWSTWNLHLDQEGTLWAGTHNGGVNWASPSGSPFRTTIAQRGGLSNPHVSSVLEDRRGHLWIGTDGSGMDELDRKTDRFTHHAHDPKDATTIGSSSIRVLIEDRRGNVWLGGWDAGLGRLDPTTGRIQRFRHDPADPRSLPSNHVWSVRELATGDLVVGTQGGTALLDRESQTFRRFSELHPQLGNGTTYTMAVEPDGGLWLCGYNFTGDSALAHIDPATGAIRHFGSTTGDPGSLARGECFSAHVDSRENVWTGSVGALNVLRAGADRFERMMPVPDMANDEVSNILEDEGGHIWVTIGPRLVRIVDGVRLPTDPRVDVFDRRDGFHGPVPLGAASRSRRGEMFFGGFAGMTSFVPHTVRQNRAAPRVVLTDIKVLNRSLRPCTEGSPLARSVPQTESLTLSHKASVITFSFAALNFWLSQKNQYAYMLEGFDRDWNYVGARHEATYTNLSPGEYSFRVRAANNDGIWSDEGTTLRLRVTPPVWGTWWFRLAALSAVVGWAFHLHRQRVGRLTAEARALSVKMEERTRLARELHDTLEQTLAGLRLQLSAAVRSLREAPDAAATNLDLARRMLAYCSEEARRTVMDLRAQELDQGDLAIALQEQARRQTLETRIAVDVKIVGAPRPLSSTTEHHLLRIAQEAVTNAVKHSGCDRVEVELGYHDTGTLLVVRDNGRGLAAGGGGNGHRFGLQGMRERAERIGGTFALETPAEGGVRIVVGAPHRDRA